MPAPELLPLVSDVPAWVPELVPLGLVSGLVLGVVLLGAFGVVNSAFTYQLLYAALLVL